MATPKSQSPVPGGRPARHVSADAAAPVRPRPDRLEYAVLALLYAILVIVRVYNIAGPIDDPHSWRQADTANYAREFYRHGMNILRPMVCWQGSAPVVALEFPLYEWLVALFYLPFGEHIAFGRALSLVSWCVAAIYLYLIVRRWGDARWARWTALLFSAAPLGIYYSRAIHIEYFTTATAHAMAYHFMRALDASGPPAGWRKHALAGALYGMASFATKLPYPALLYAPLGIVALRAGNRMRSLTMIPWLALPWLAFMAWRVHANHINRAAPDYSWNPGMSSLVHMEWWYYGSLAQRLVFTNWLFLGARILFECLTPLGVPLLGIGTVMARRNALKHEILRWWLVAAVVYLLVFWNLNGQHNYYQIPFIAPLAIVMGVPLARWMERGRMLRTVAVAVAAGFTLYACNYALTAYFIPDPIVQVVGKEIRARTMPADIVLGASATTHPGDPRVLYAADRHGFMILDKALTKERLDRFIASGATFLAVIVTDEQAVPAVFQGYRVTRVRMREGAKMVATLYCARLRAPVREVTP